MKKSIKALLIFLLLLAVIIGIAPNFLRLENVRRNIVSRVSQQLDSEMNTAAIQWKWLPIPHFTLLDSQIINENAKFILPEVLVYPKWWSLFQDTVQLRKIHLKNPHIHLKSFQSKGEQKRPSLPQTKIVIDNGLLTLDKDLIRTDIIKQEALRFSTSRTELLIRSDQIKFSSQGVAPFGKDIHLLGQFNLTDKSYLAKIDVQGLMLYKGISSLSAGNIVPVEPEVNLTGHIKGTGTHTFTAGLKGTFPCFLAKPQDRELLINCGYTDMVLDKSGNTLTLRINKLQLKEPGITLQGSVIRQAPNTSENPLWRIDLAARDLNLSEIREGVLTLWGNNKTAVRVCNIVLGGVASTAGFQFEGPTSDFKDIEAMTITADVTSAAIHIPKVDLDLTEAKGPITIKKGILTGHTLSTRLGNSLGKNGSFTLGLTKDNDSFKLDVDLEADLASLPGTLNKVVHNPAFINEMNRFSEIQGRASGHLVLGDMLDNISVRVAVDDMKAKMAYDRLQWPLDIQQGTLLIAPEKVKWQGVKAEIGPHRLRTLSGLLSWNTGLYLNIDQFSATLDSESFFSELKKNSVVPKNISGALTAIQGPLVVKKGILYGPLQRPESWKYYLEISSEDLTFDSPLLPASVTAEHASLAFSHKELKISECDIRLFDHSLRLKGNLNHTNLEHWYGDLEVNGTVRNKLANWIKKNNWVPDLYFPRIPFTLKDFNISWNENKTEVVGEIIADTVQTPAPKAVVNLVVSPERLLIKQFDIFSENEQGHLALDIRQDTSIGPLFVWKGSISANTFNRFFENNILKAGNVKGNCRLDVWHESGIPFLSGSLQVDGLRWQWSGDLKSTAIADLLIAEKNNLVAVERFDLRLNQESLKIQGQVATVAQGLKLQLDLLSPSLSGETIREFLSDLHSDIQKMDTLDTGKRDDTSGLYSWDVTGKISFKVDSFSANLQPASSLADSIPAVLVWKPFIGYIEFQPRDEKTIRVTSSTLCGIEMTGAWHSDESQALSSFAFSTPTDIQPLFQKVLPCLGSEQELIEGRFDLNAELQGNPGQWQGGYLKVVSTQGRILRMKLLSKILSVINITDLFSSDEITDFNHKGFPYSEMDLQAVIKDNRLLIRRAIIRGEGLNLFAKGEMDLGSHDADFTVLIAPLKSIDSLVGKMPLVGKAIGGENTALVTIPVGVKGNINDPDVTILPPQAVGDAFLNFVKETVKLPFSILSPILSNGK